MLGAETKSEVKSLFKLNAVVMQTSEYSHTNAVWFLRSPFVSALMFRLRFQGFPSFMPFAHVGSSCKKHMIFVSWLLKALVPDFVYY